MKKRLSALCVVLALCLGLLLPCATPVAAQGYPLPADLPLHASSALLVNLAGNPQQDVVLYEKNADQVRAPGAMMRYMVLAYALHRIEEQGLNIDTATGSYNSHLFNNYVAGTGVPTANMAYGETWRLRDLLAVSFIHNASDAVVVLAEAIDGDVDTFVRGMNTLALEIGCTNSHFYWLSGLDSLSQYTTARDMYRIVRYCQNFSLFTDLVSTNLVTVQPVSGGSRRTLETNNALMLRGSYYYEGMQHSRTGLSQHDGRNCTSVAYKDGYEYLVVVMGCPEVNDNGEKNLHYRDTKQLLDWAFDDFEHKIVLTENEILGSLPLELAWKIEHINLVPAHSFATVVDKDMDPDQILRDVVLYEESLTAPVEKGTVYGKVELYVNVDQKIGEVDLIAAQGAQRSSMLYFWHQLKTGLGAALPWLLGGVGLLVVLIVAYVALNIVYNRRRRRRKLSRVNHKR